MTNTVIRLRLKPRLLSITIHQIIPLTISCQTN